MRVEVTMVRNRSRMASIRSVILEHMLLYMHVYRVGGRAIASVDVMARPPTCINLVGVPCQNTESAQYATRTSCSAQTVRVAYRADSAFWHGTRPPSLYKLVGVNSCSEWYIVQILHFGMAQVHQVYTTWWPCHHIHRGNGTATNSIDMHPSMGLRAHC